MSSLGIRVFTLGSRAYDNPICEGPTSTKPTARLFPGVVRSSESNGVVASACHREMKRRAGFGLVSYLRLPYLKERP